MAQGSKAKYTDKQKRQARHIAEGVRKRGGSKAEAARIGYATVNKEDGGGNKSGSGRGIPDNHRSSRKGGHESHRARTHESYVQAGRKAARTRARKAA